MPVYQTYSRWVQTKAFRTYGSIPSHFHRSILKELVIHPLGYNPRL
jgi:hypothetical protein